MNEVPVEIGNKSVAKQIFTLQTGSKLGFFGKRAAGKATATPQRRTNKSKFHLLRIRRTWLPPARQNKDKGS